MLVMGLDTALQRCSVAILQDDAILAEEAVGMERGHAEQIAPMTAAALHAAGVKIADLDRIGVVVGPGGFTGVRVALAFARGLAVGTGVPVVGVTSLAALAGNVGVGNRERDSLVAAVVDARRGQVYAALYDGDETLVEPFVADPEQALRRLARGARGRPVLTVGTGAGLMLVPPGEWRACGAPDQIEARVVARLAAAAPAPSGPPKPLYLRPPDAKPSSAGAQFGRRGS